MKSLKPIFLTCLFTSLCTLGCNSSSGTTDAPKSLDVESADAPSAVEVIDAMVADCAACAEDRAARHAETPLYLRLGGHEGVSAFVDKLVELHMQNEVVAPYFEGVDQDRLAKHLVDFIGAGTGGAETYEGRSILDSHAGMGVTPEVFLAAGGDIGAAMQAVGWGPDEQQEFMCIILSMRDDVLMEPGSEE